MFYVPDARLGIERGTTQTGSVIFIYILERRQNKQVEVRVLYNKVKVTVKVLVAQSCPTLCNPMDPPGSSVHETLQARILEWVAIPFSRGSSQPKGQSRVSRIADRFFII